MSRLAAVCCAVLLLGSTALLTTSCSDESQESEQLTPEQIQGNLIRQLIMMADQKEQSRDQFDSLVNEKGWRSPEVEEAMRSAHVTDSTNMVILEEIIAQHGWPGKSLVGNQAAMAAFIILQHATLEQQEKYLLMIKEAAEKGEVEKTHLAMLQDRVLMRQGQPQLYGTQLWNDPSTGQLGLYPIEDSANVEARREEIGLPPISEYLRSIGINPDSLGGKPKDNLKVIVN